MIGTMPLHPFIIEISRESVIIGWNDDGKEKNAIGTLAALRVSVAARMALGSQQSVTTGRMHVCYLLFGTKKYNKKELKQLRQIDICPLRFRNCLYSVIVTSV